MTRLTPEQLGESDVFDLSFGPMVPDQEIMQTGRVSVDAYLSEERYQTEKQIFRKSWLHVACEQELPNPGDWMTYTIDVLDASLLLIRGKDGRIRTFHNMCTHRGTKLVWGDKGTASQFACPYHAWIFDAEGTLRNMPGAHCFSDLNRAEFGLTPIATDVWAGLIFVNLDPHPAVGLREWLGPVVDLLDGAPFGDYKLACRMSGPIDANWKLFVESQSEAYHVSSLHRLTAKDFIYSRDLPSADFCGLESLGAHRRATSPRNLDYAPDPKKPFQTIAFGSLPHLFLRDGETSGYGSFEGKGINKDKVAHWGVELYQIFPNFGLNITLNGFWTTFAWPTSPTTAMWEARYYFLPPKSDQERVGTEYSLVFNRDTLLEDVICTEQQQAMLGSGGRDFIQFGEENEYVLRHEAAVWHAMVERLQHGPSRPELVRVGAGA